MLFVFKFPAYFMFKIDVSLKSTEKLHDMNERRSFFFGNQSLRTHALRHQSRSIYSEHHLSHYLFILHFHFFVNFNFLGTETEQTTISLVNNAKHFRNV